MALLLDTHALLWFLQDDSRLPAQTRIVIETTPNVSVSLASFWEISIKLTLGKLALEVSFEELINVYVPRQKMRLLPVTSAHLTDLRHLPLHHRDPFDRMLIAQARVEGLTLISRDEHVWHYDVSVRWQ